MDGKREEEKLLNIKREIDFKKSNKRSEQSLKNLCDDGRTSDVPTSRQQSMGERREAEQRSQK